MAGALSTGPRAATSDWSRFSLTSAAHGPDDVKFAKVALASRIAVRTSVRSLPNEASSARELPSGARRTYRNTVSEPQRP